MRWYWYHWVALTLMTAAALLGALAIGMKCWTQQTALVGLALILGACGLVFVCERLAARHDRAKT
jgi:uncharacterized membrane protein YhaH (DUF805 family)